MSIRSDEQNITIKDLKTQLAEKEKEIERYKKAIKHHLRFYEDELEILIDMGCEEGETEFFYRFNMKMQSKNKFIINRLKLMSEGLLKPMIKRTEAKK
ncbi:hypothetical protein N9924_01125 [bacterium]|nr:hypothetical protein [bacterium]